MSSDPQLRFDLKNFQVLLEGRTLELRPQCLDLLKHMAERPGQLLSKQELMDAVWHDKVVTEASLSQAIKQLRTAIGDDAQSPRYIETVHRRGYRFIGHSNLQTATPAAGNVQQQLTALVGREQEISRLHELYEKSRLGRRQLCFVTGEAGIGKTSLLNEFSDQLQSFPAGEGCMIARGQCIEQVGGGEPYLPILDALQRLALSERGDMVTGLLRRWAPSWVMQMPWLLPEGQSYDPEILAITRVRMLREFCLFLEELSRDAPVIICLEDLHWGDRSTVELMDAFSRREEPANVLWLASFRPVDAALDDAPILSLSRSAVIQESLHMLELDPLSRETVRDYLGARFPGLDSLNDFGDMCSELTDGNPLFVKTHADFVVSTGLLSQEGGQWVTNSDLDTIHKRSPESLRAIINQRLENISPEERSLLEVAAVLGVEFSGLALAGVAGMEINELDAALGSLLEGGHFIGLTGQSDWPNGSSGPLYNFSHDVYRWVLYHGLSPSRLQHLHLECARALHAGYQGSEAEIAAELAKHYELGRDYSRAIHCLKKSAERALFRASHAAAIATYDRALSLVSSLRAAADAKAEELDILIGRSRVFISAINYTDDDLLSGLHRALSLSREIGDPQIELVVLAQLCACSFFRGDLQDTKLLLVRVSELSGESTDPVLLSHEAFICAMCALLSGQLNEAENYFQRCLELAESIELREAIRVTGHDFIMFAQCSAGICAWLRGQPEEARRRAERGVQRAEAVAVPGTKTGALDVTMTIDCLRGDSDAAQKTLTELDNLIQSYFGDYAYPRLLASRSWLLRHSGDVKGAITAMREGIDKARLNNAGAFVGLMYNTLAEAYLAAGESTEALSATEQALDVAKLGQRVFEAESWRLRGEALGQQGKTEESLECFAQAQAVAREQNALSLELRAVISRLETQNNGEEAAGIRERLSAIVDQCETSSSDAGLQRADKLLQEV